MQTDPKRRTILTFAEAEDMHVKLAESAAHTAKWLAARTNDDPMSPLRAMRFDAVGHDPLTGEPLNVVEQLNQTFTILVSLRAIEQLFEIHPDAGGFRLALGTSSGRDIESVKERLVAAEVFSATRRCRPGGGWNWAWRILREHEGIVSGCEVNRLIAGLYGEHLPSIDLAHIDLSRGEQRPEQHGCAVC